MGESSLFNFTSVSNISSMSKLPPSTGVCQETDRFFYLHSLYW